MGCSSVKTGSALLWVMIVLPSCVLIGRMRETREFMRRIKFILFKYPILLLFFTASCGGIKAGNKGQDPVPEGRLVGKAPLINTDATVKISGVASVYSL